MRKCLDSYVHFSHTVLLILAFDINKSLWLLYLQELRATQWGASQIPHDSFISYWWEISRWLLERGYYSRNGSLCACTMFYIFACSICSQLLLETEKCAKMGFWPIQILLTLEQTMFLLCSYLWSFPPMTSCINLILKHL